MMDKYVQCVQHLVRMRERRMFQTLNCVNYSIAVKLSQPEERERGRKGERRSFRWTILVGRNGVHGSGCLRFVSNYAFDLTEFV